MLMGSGCFTRSHQKSFPCCAPICSDNLRWFTSEGMNNALARKTRLARTRSSPYGLCWLHVLSCSKVSWRCNLFHVRHHGSTGIWQESSVCFQLHTNLCRRPGLDSETTRRLRRLSWRQSDYAELPRSSPMISLTWRRDLVTTRSQRPVTQWPSDPSFLELGM